MRTTSRQTITGTVISDRMDKTVIVQTETRKQHPRYKKFITRRKRYKAHDEENECRLGDMVTCMECRPLSKDKRWRIVEILRRKYVSTEEIVETDELVMKKEKPVQKAAAQAPETEAPESVAGAAEPEAEVEPEAAAEEAQEAEETVEEVTEETTVPEEAVAEEAVEADAQEPEAAPVDSEPEAEPEEVKTENGTEPEAQEIEEQQEAETGETDDTGGVKA